MSRLKNYLMKNYGDDFVDNLEKGGEDALRINCIS